MSARAEHAAVLADRLAETVRDLNHLTLDPHTLTPPEVYRVVADVRTAIERLPQLLNQLAANVRERADLTYSDRGEPQDIDEAMGWLRSSAFVLAGELEAPIRYAAEALAHLGYRGD